MEGIQKGFSKNQVIQHLLDQEQLAGIGSCFSDFIRELEFPVYLKDAQTGKFILSNAHHVYLRKNIGALQSPDDLIGLTADDLQNTQSFVPSRIYKIANALKSALKIDAKSIGRSSMEMMKNLDKRKIIAVLAYDLPLHHSLFNLFRLYQEYYSDRLSVVLFLNYLSIEHCFYRPPTAKEMQIFLMLYQQPNRKKATQLLNISYNTLTSYLQHIKEEILIKPNLNEVLDQLRKITLLEEGRSHFDVSGCCRWKDRLGPSLQLH